MSRPVFDSRVVVGLSLALVVLGTAFLVVPASAGAPTPARCLRSAGSARERRRQFARIFRRGVRRPSTPPGPRRRSAPSVWRSTPTCSSTRPSAVTHAASATDPADWRWRYYALLIRAERGDADGVKRGAVAVLEQEPGLAAAWWRLGDATPSRAMTPAPKPPGSGRPNCRSPRASTAIRRRMSRKCRLPRTRAYGLARVALARDDRAAAQTLLERVTSTAPRFGSAFRLLADIYLPARTPGRCRSRASQGGSSAGVRAVCRSARRRARARIEKQHVSPAPGIRGRAVGERRVERIPHAARARIRSEQPGRHLEDGAPAAHARPARRGAPVLHALSRRRARRFQRRHADRRRPPRSRAVRGGRTLLP